MTAYFPQAMPLQGLLGGLMIGVAAAIMLLGNGRIAGVSGLFAKTVGLAKDGAPLAMAVAFVIGLPLGAFLVASITPVTIRMPTSPLLIIAGGILVGFGTRLGSGCTSGHGVCGLSRLSPRSVGATAAFMSAGVITVTLMRLAGVPS